MAPLLPLWWGSPPQQLLPDRCSMAPLGRQLVVSTLREISREVGGDGPWLPDLQIGVLEPSAWSRVNTRHHALVVEDAHVVSDQRVRPPARRAGVASTRVLGDEFDVHHAAGDCLRSNSPRQLSTGDPGILWRISRTSRPGSAGRDPFWPAWRGGWAKLGDHRLITIDGTCARTRPDAPRSRLPAAGYCS